MSATRRRSSSAASARAPPYSRPQAGTYPYYAPSRNHRFGRCGFRQTFERASSTTSTQPGRHSVSASRCLLRAGRTYDVTCSKWRDISECASMLRNSIRRYAQPGAWLITLRKYALAVPIPRVIAFGYGDFIAIQSNLRLSQSSAMPSPQPERRGFGRRRQGKGEAEVIPTSAECWPPSPKATMRMGNAVSGRS